MMNNIITRINSIPLVRKVLGEKATEEFIKYLIVGGTSFVLDYSFMHIFAIIIQKIMPNLAHHLAVTYGNTCSVTLVFGFNFLANRFWTYRSTSNIWRQLVSYVPLFIFNLFASDFMMLIMLKNLGIDSWIAKPISIGIIICWNIPLYKKFVFK